MNAMLVYYQILQIAHMINQLFEPSQQYKKLREMAKKLTAIAIREKMRAIMSTRGLSVVELEETNIRCQVRLVFKE